MISNNIIPSTSEKFPVIGQGMTGLGTEKYHDRKLIDQRINALRHGVNLGFNFIDTASLYGGGFSEVIVGEALQGIRNKCFLSSKFYPYDSFSANDVRKSVINSLKSLKTDYLDLYQIHWPNPFMNQDEILGALDDLVMKGMIRYIGASNYCSYEINRTNNLLNNKLISNQYEFNLLNRSVLNDIKDIDSNILLIAYSPLNQGRLASNQRQLQCIEEIACKKGISVAGVVILWILQHNNIVPIVPIVKMSSMLHMDELYDALKKRLSIDEIQLINEHSSKEIEYIPVDKIILSGDKWRAPYNNKSEAMNNIHDLIPSPLSMAERIKLGASEMPIRVIPNDAGGYDIDKYDPFDQIKKYWSWVLAKPGEDIPAYIIDKK